MSDGKGAVQNTFETVGENVINPVKDEVGQMIETGIQAITGQTSAPKDPEEAKKKQEEEAKKKAWANQTIDWYKKIEEEQAKVRAQNQQKNQVQAQEQQQKMANKFQEAQTKKQSRIHLEREMTKSERRGGVGG